MSVRVGIVGAAGRMGLLLQGAAKHAQRFKLGALVVAPGSSTVGKPSELSAISYSSDLQQEIGTLDCVLDFSTPAQSVRSVEICAELGRPILVGVTGHSDAERARIERMATRAPIALTSNTSLGVVVMHAAAAQIARLLGDSVDVEICESHHRAKRDAPSGTALSLARCIAAERPGAKAVMRTSESGPREPHEIGIVSLRGGDTPGEHAVYFYGDGERIELHHRVRDRAVFARGAFVLLDRLIDRPPGMYSAAQLLTAGG